MSVRNQLKLIVGGLNARRTGQPPPASAPGMSEFLERSRLIAVLIFIVTVAAIVLISSAGLSTLNVIVQPNQVATSRVTALTAFSYESSEKTEAARGNVRAQVPPVYRLEVEPLRKFETAARTLLTQLAAYEMAHPGQPPSATLRPEIVAFADRFNAQGPYNAAVEDIAALLTLDAKARSTLFDLGLATLRDIYTEGVSDPALASAAAGGAAVFQIVRATGETSPRAVQSYEEALTLLRVALSADTAVRPGAVFRIFRHGITANLIFDRAETEARQGRAMQGIKPVVVNVARGQSIVDAGERVTHEQHEALIAHRQQVRDHDGDVQEGLTLFGRVLLVLAMVLASLIYIRIEDPETLRSNVRCGLLALVVIVNLALVRAIYSLGGAEFFVRDGSWASTLPYVAPTAFAPLIVAILIDAGSGIFMALLISIFTGVIYGNRLDLLVLTFLASMVAIFFGRDVRRRGKLVRAAGAGGLTVAAFAAMIGFAEQTAVDTVLRQAIAGLGIGLLTGIAVVGLLPVLESLFKRTTDITLLELTDYNHPLLRRMQLEAPGTYHHSLVVAQLSENAANAIGANPLVARVCALFHDVGKTLNPQFFGENQRDRVNPHTELDPMESARLIRQHVSDGVELAQKHQLPKSVIDVIKQHHGTTLVRYFYHRAVEQSRAPFATLTPARKAVAEVVGSASPLPPRPGDSANPLEPLRARASTPLPPNAPPEQAFRYEGPRPQFKESAIISLADGVEATTRSLRQIGPEQLHELINRVIEERIVDGQLDEAPLTLEEITRIKNSFQFTLLNMLHARVAYPKAEDTAAIASEAGR